MPYSIDEKMVMMTPRVASDLKAFHRRALDVGSVGLDVLKDAVLR